MLHFFFLQLPGLAGAVRYSPGQHGQGKSNLNIVIDSNPLATAPTAEQTLQTVFELSPSDPSIKWAWRPTRLIHLYPLYKKVYALVQRNTLHKYACILVQTYPLWQWRYCYKGTLWTSMHAYLYKGYLCSSNVTVTKVPIGHVCIHTCTKGTFVTVTLSSQRYPLTSMHTYVYKRYLCNSNITLQWHPLYKYAYILLQRVPL